MADVRGRAGWLAGAMIGLLVAEGWAWAQGPAAEEAQPTPPPMATATSLPTPLESDIGEGSGAAVGVERPFLWEVTGPAGTSYIFGTIHLGVSAEELPERFWERFRAARAVIFEADIRSADLLGLAQQALLPAGQSLDQLFEPEVWSQLVAAIGPVMPEPLLRRFRPWVVQSYLYAMLLPPNQPMDATLLTQAAEADKELVFLETLDEQMGLLNSMPNDPVVEDLAEYARTPDAYRAELDSLVSAYRRGDGAGVQAVMLDPEELRRFPEFFEVLIRQRNQSWVETIDAELRDGGAFVAVGLGHLIGPGSVVELLGQRGYAVHRLE